MPKKTFRLIATRGADALIQLKSNQPKLLAQAQKRDSQEPKISKTFYDKGHGRFEERTIKVHEFDCDMPFVRTLVVAQRTRTITKTNQISKETAYYLSTAENSRYSAQRWGSLIRGHWAGIEIRNHWRRDALWNEDRTRTRNSNICGVIALLRNTCLAALARYEESFNFNKLKEYCTNDLQIPIDIITKHKMPKKLLRAT